MLNKTAASGKGHFGDLTDDLLRHVLSFLPAADALQTCVLDTGWRDHWRRTTSLPLIFDQSSFPSSERFKQLVKLFIHIRGNSPLDKCKIVACLDDVEERTYTNTILLIEYALKCQVKELLLSVAVDKDFEFEPLILDAPLISQHLKILHLERFELKRSTLNFSRCSVLEELEMQDCNIDARRISSKSLKRLCITDFCSFPTKFHIRIFAPGLISLQLDNFDGLTPSLEYMPSLETAYVWLHNSCYDSCHSNRQNCEYEDCSCHAYPVDEGVLLHGLSNAVNLELFIYRWDLECCPIFDKLKTLSLNEWFTTIDLLCILQHSPVLEVLTLQLGSTEKFVRATGAEEKIEQSFVCSHLKVVNIECRKVDEGVHKILKFLSKCGILRDQISITHRFSFQKPMRPLPRSTTEPGGLSSFHP
ncbi:F-box/FBD/LRR-repeat protein At3g14710-like isoform X2 [Triticum dicoccoides]|nr:F-box/FBD/LRR-repeat protein At3g14710-like isoform X2 [Triticum dicoccoides]